MGHKSSKVYHWVLRKSCLSIPFVRDTREPLIVYWDCIWSTLQTIGVYTRLIFTQGFWPQSQVTIVESNTAFYNNGDVREDFTSYDHYVGPTHNHLVPSFHVAIDCYKGCMGLTYAREEHPKTNLLMKALLSPNFISTIPDFYQIEVEYYHPST